MSIFSRANPNTSIRLRNVALESDRSIKFINRSAIGIVDRRFPSLVSHSYPEIEYTAAPQSKQSMIKTTWLDDLVRKMNAIRSEHGFSS